MSTVENLKVGDEIAPDKIVYMTSFLGEDNERIYIHVVYAEKVEKFWVYMTDSSQLLARLRYYHKNIGSAISRINYLVTKNIKEDGYNF